MRIIKLAGKKVLLRLTFDYGSGKTEARVVGNAEGCSSESNDEVFNEALIRDLMEAEVSGHGTLDVIDSGLTFEGELAQKQKNRTKLMKKHITTKPVLGTPEEEPQHQQYQTPELDTGGMGV